MNLLPRGGTILLAIVQGITEFLPVSSSGHLILLSTFLPGITASLSLNVYLHLGSLAAILIYFKNRWTQVLTSPRILRNIFLSALPAGIAGVAFADQIEQALYFPVPVALALLLGSLIIFLGNRRTTSQSPGLSCDWRTALGIGLFQALALIPGASRSGMTIAGGLILGLNKKDAAEFSFLASIPPILGASLLEIIAKPPTLPFEKTTQLLWGTLLTFFASLITIRWLLRYLQQKNLLPFILYRLGLGLLILTYALLA